MKGKYPPRLPKPEQVERALEMMGKPRRFHTAEQLDLFPTLCGKPVEELQRRHDEWREFMRPMGNDDGD